MAEVSTIGLDVAKNVFQAHGADASGAVLFRKKLRRHQVLTFFAAQPLHDGAHDLAQPVRALAQKVLDGSGSRFILGAGHGGDPLGG